MHVNRGLIRALTAAVPDLVVVAGYAGLTNQVAMRWLHWRRIPWVFWGEVPGMKPRGGLGAVLRWLAQRPAARWSDGFAAIGSRAVEAYRRMSRGRCPVANIPYGCDTAPFLAIRRDAHHCKDRLRFLYCGQLIRRKGVDLLLAAFCKAAAVFPKIELVLVGEGPIGTELQSQIPPPIRPRVRFAGFQPVAELPRFFAAADVFVLPSRHDGWGVVVNQAVAAGLPLICSGRRRSGGGPRGRERERPYLRGGLQRASSAQFPRSLSSLRRSAALDADPGRLRLSGPSSGAWTDGPGSCRKSSPHTRRRWRHFVAEPSMLRVLLVSSSSGSEGGGELYLVNLAEGLNALGHEVEVLLSDHVRMDSLARLMHPGAKIHRAPYRNTYDRPLRTIGAVLDRPLIHRMRELLRGLRPDVIHINKQNLEDGLDLILAAAKSGLSCVSTIHITRDPASLGAWAGPLRGWLARSVLRRTRTPCLTIARTCADELAIQLGSSFPRSRIHCVLNGVCEPPPTDREAIRREWKCNSGDVVLGCLARIESQKNPLFLVGLLPDLPRCVRLVWVGDGRLRGELLETAWRLGVQDRVRVEGWRSDARARLAAFDLFALPSQYEGLPLAVIEAMAACLPCVASAVDGICEAIRHGENGYLCPSNDRAAWLACLRQLIANETLRSAYRRVGAKALS